MRAWALLGLSACALRTDDLDRDGWSLLDAPPDCDDGDPDRFPLHSEIAEDGIDQDCNGADLLMRAIGVDHACDLEADGLVFCAGDNSYGQLDVPADRHFVEIACGDFHTCGLEDVGSVTCWGDDRYGQAEAPAGFDFVRIDADRNWSLAIRESGALDCWGACWTAAGRLARGRTSGR